MAEKRKGLIVIVSAPSGSGKTTLVNGLIEETQGITRSVSYTTRAPRDGEREGDDYIFVTEDVFKEKQGKGLFLECEENFGKFYGTSIEQVREAQAEGNDIILSIDVKGARRVKDIFPESIGIFIMPPSAEELTKRLKDRKTDDVEQLLLRIKESKKEIEAAEEYDYMVVNEEIDKAVAELREIITIERNNLQKQGEDKKDERNT